MLLDIKLYNKQLIYKFQINNKLLFFREQRSVKII